MTMLKAIAIKTLNNLRIHGEFMTDASVQVQVIKFAVVEN